MKQFATIILVMIGLTSFSQVSSSTIGLRAGGVSGFTFKLIDPEFDAVEVILGFQNDGVRMTGLIQKFRPIKTDRIANLYLFSGWGGHTGYIKYDDYTYKTIDGITYYNYQKKFAPVIGGDLMIGVEYHFESIPFHISMDYKPYFEFFGEKTFRMDFWDIGFSIRYVINN